MEMLNEQERFDFGNLSRDIDLHDLEMLDEKRWDLLDELAAIELSKAALLQRIRGMK